jgi:hypothetical protein
VREAPQNGCVAAIGTSPYGSNGQGMKYAIVGGMHLQDTDGFDQQGDQLGIIHVSGAPATQGHDSHTQVQGLEEMPPASETDLAAHQLKFRRAMAASSNNAGLLLVGTPTAAMQLF